MVYTIQLTLAQEEKILKLVDIEKIYDDEDIQFAIDTILEQL
jgi:hypothetical protein